MNTEVSKLRSRALQQACIAWRHLFAPAFLISAAVVILKAPNAGATSSLHYSLVDDWSDTHNPTGPWSYNLNTSPITTYQTFWWGQSGWGYFSVGDGCILKGLPPAGPDPFGGVAPPAHDWQPGDVMMTALSIPYGGDSTFLNVTWTSPANGMLDITGRAWDGEIISGRDVAWSLFVGGQVIAQRSSTRGLYRGDPGAQLSANLVGNNTLTGIPVTQGEVVEFRVITDTYYGHFVGVQEDLTLTPIPEPRVGGLIAAGLIATLLASKRRWLVVCREG